MISFDVTIRDPLGIHARPAGQLAKLAKEYAGTVISVTKGDKTVKATQVMMLMGLGIRQGETVTVSAEGKDEEKAADALREFFEKNL